jgi:hypothetical protein
MHRQADLHGADEFKWSSSVLECAILKRINAGTCSKSLPDLNGFYRTGASKIPYP